MNRHHRRRHARQERGRWKTRSAAFLTPEQTAEALDRCDCPAAITVGSGLLTVEHYHHSGCPNLYPHEVKP